MYYVTFICLPIQEFLKSESCGEATPSYPSGLHDPCVPQLGSHVSRVKVVGQLRGVGLEAATNQQQWQRGDDRNRGRLRDTGKCAHGHRPRQALPISTFTPPACPFVSVVGPLQLWSHQGHKWAGRRCRCGRCPSGTVFACVLRDRATVAVTVSALVGD